MGRKINVNVRVDEQLLNELDMVALALNMQRSDLFRGILEYWRNHGIIEVEGEERKYSEVVEGARQTLTEEDARLVRSERQRQRAEGPKRIIVCATCYTHLTQEKECDHHGESVFEESGAVGT